MEVNFMNQYTEGPTCFERIKEINRIFIGNIYTYAHRHTLL